MPFFKLPPIIVLPVGRTIRPRQTYNLYNAHPTWLDLAHKPLDEAIFAAYGWKSDLSDSGDVGEAAVAKFGEGEINRMI